ncbi:hypothetical protein [Alkalihalobacillus trypoxylicola]|uniref:Uncharacterized protein n=1 Tax=Alkalihalobacillus trypoxylicola TaxID=519424 RepID=A0A162D0K5_9BACI|nr:hypothetical protein [Alkalihalobacillus trypoxylicola]KYG27605.1 hypothetical protein AZF04_10440 [Alkalihalobacillus trypoxylicola]
MEVIINFGLFFLFVLFIAVLSTLAKKYPFLRSIGKVIKYVLIAIAFLFFILLSIVVYSSLAFITISTFSFFLENPPFLVNGERFNAFMADEAVFKLVVSFGIFYFLINIISIFGFGFLKLHYWVQKLFVTLTTSLATIFIFPLLIQSLFTDVYISVSGGLILVVVILILAISQLIRREKRAYERYRHPFKYYRDRLIPWIKTGKDPGKNDPYNY